MRCMQTSTMHTSNNTWQSFSAVERRVALRFVAAGPLAWPHKGLIPSHLTQELSNLTRISQHSIVVSPAMKAFEVLVQSVASVNVLCPCALLERKLFQAASVVKDLHGRLRPRGMEDVPYFLIV